MPLRSGAIGRIGGLTQASFEQAVEGREPAIVDPVADALVAAGLLIIVPVDNALTYGGAALTFGGKTLTYSGA